LSSAHLLLLEFVLFGAELGISEKEVRLSDFPFVFLFNRSLKEGGETGGFDEIFGDLSFPLTWREAGVKTFHERVHSTLFGRLPPSSQ